MLLDKYFRLHKKHEIDSDERYIIESRHGLEDLNFYRKSETLKTSSNQRLLECVRRLRLRS